MPLTDLIPYFAAAICVAAAWAVTMIAMQNWRGDKYLCDDCIFNNDNDCHKSERPQALKCTVYRNATIDEYRM